MPSCAAMAPIAQHRGGDAQLASNLDQRPTAARQQGNRLPLELIRKMTPFLAHSTPFRSRRSLAKVSTNAGEAQPWPRRNFGRFGLALWLWCVNEPGASVDTRSTTLSSITAYQTAGRNSLVSTSSRAAQTRSQDQRPCSRNQ